MEERPFKIVKDPADKANYDRRVRSIIFHYAVASEEKTLKLLKHIGVSVHFLVPRNQEDPATLKAIEIVKMNDRAWRYCTREKSRSWPKISLGIFGESRYWCLA